MFGRGIQFCHVLHLSGNARTSRRTSARQKQETCSVEVHVHLLLSQSLSKIRTLTHEGCKIQYRDIGDYLTREEKLEIHYTRRSQSQVLLIGKRLHLIPTTIGLSNAAKRLRSSIHLAQRMQRQGKADDAIFKLFSGGYKTGRDAYIYNFSHDACAENAKRMTQVISLRLLNLRKTQNLLWTK